MFSRSICATATAKIYVQIEVNGGSKIDIAALGTISAVS